MRELKEEPMWLMLTDTPEQRSRREFRQRSKDARVRSRRRRYTVLWSNVSAGAGQLIPAYLPVSKFDIDRESDASDWENGGDSEPECEDEGTQCDDEGLLKEL
jgi:hypothetical protein